MFAPITEALIKEGGIGADQSVLDVAGGTGEPSLAIAKVVGQKGTVMCTDAIAEMVSAAKGQANDLGLTNIQFRECEADSLPFADNQFDVSVSRLGVMFFPNVLASLREMLRVTKSRLAFAVWGESRLNPFSYTVTDVVARHSNSDPGDPNAPGAFRFAEPGKLAGLLTEAGATEVRERSLDFHIQAPISIKQFWEVRSQTSGTLRAKLALLPAEEAKQIRQEVEAAAREFFVNDRMDFPARMIIVTGQKRSGS